MPDDQLFAIRRGERDLLGLREAGRRRRRAQVSGKYISARWNTYISVNNPP